MATPNEQLARAGYEAAMRGDLEALARLMASDLTWHWWKRGPWDCHSREEALAVIEERLRQKAIGDLREVTDLGAGEVLIVTGLRPDSEVTPEDLGLDEGHDEVATLVTIRHGTVVAMRDYRRREDAIAAVSGRGGA